MSDQESPEPLDKHPVMYVSDPTWIFHDAPEPAPREYLEGIVAELARAGVTMLAHDVYLRGMVFFPSKTHEIYGGDVTVFEKAFTYWWVERFRRFVKEGADPLTVMLDASHRHGLAFLASLRMNDRHPMHPGITARFLIDNQERIGMHVTRDHPPGCSLYNYGMDYRRQEVRDHVISVIDEIVRGWDVDGVQLDWMRWRTMFSYNVPPEERIAIMTAFHRRVRALLDEAGARKGRKLLLAVRVPQVIEECERLGFDVGVYIKEGIADIVCPSDFFFLDPKAQIAEFAALARGTDVRIMPSLHPRRGQEDKGFPTLEQKRACAHSCYRQGAHGLSFYNWFCDPAFGFPQDAATLSEAGDPKRIARGERHYYFGPITDSVPGTEDERWSRYGRACDYLVVPRTLTGRRHAFTFRVKEDFPGTRCDLRFKLEGFTDRDAIEIDLNGARLDPEERFLSFARSGQRPSHGWPVEPYYLVGIEDAERWLRDGDNEIGVVLIAANDALPDVDIRLIEVELRVGAPSPNWTCDIGTRLNVFKETKYERPDVGPVSSGSRRTREAHRPLAL